MINRTFSIRDKLIFYLVILSIISISILGLITYFIAKDALLSRAFSQLDAIRTVKTREVQNFFEDRINSSIKLSILKNEIDNKFDNINKKNIKNLKYFLNDKYVLGLIFIKDNKSIIIKKNSSLVYNSYILDEFNLYEKNSKENNILFSDLEINKNFIKPFVLFGIGDNNLKIFSVVSVEALNEIMLEKPETEGFEKSAESYLVGSDKLMRSESKFKKNSILNIKVDTKGFNSGMNNHSGTDIFPDYRGIKVMSSYSPVKIYGIKWVILSEIDLSEVMQPVKELRNYILFISIALIVLIFIAAVRIAYKFSQPIINLTNASIEIESGKEIKVEKTTNDEIGELTDSFNKMTKSLIEKQSEIEKEKNKGYSLYIDAQEHERERLSRELHDGLGQNLIALKLHLEKAKNSDINEKVEIIDNVIKNVNLSIDEVRRISNNLMPAVLKEFGIVTAINNLSGNICNFCDIKIEKNIDKNFKITDKKVKIYLYRIIQEALNNAIKHSKADKLIIALKQESNIINLGIIDDGIGFEVNHQTEAKGNGLFNIRERVKILNGEFNLISKINVGTKINISIPVEL